MADIKISQLGAAAAVVDADVIPATANGVTVKVPASVLKEYAIGGTDISSIGDGTPTGAISALKSVKIEKTDIAPIETSVTSKAYAVGDQLYYNGMLYSVIAAIAQGETLVVDTNIELSDKVTEQIKALNGEVGTLNSALTNVESDIAPIEDGTNYSTSYTKGAQFIRGGLLYEVTASSVNSSTAINTASGGNATLADNITEQISYLQSNKASNHWNTVGSRQGTTIFYFSEYGKTINELFIEVYIGGTANLITFVIPFEAIPSGGGYYINGGYGISTSEAFLAEIQLTPTLVKLIKVASQTSDVTSSSVIAIFAR